MIDLKGGEETPKPPHRLDHNYHADQPKAHMTDHTYTQKLPEEDLDKRQDIHLTDHNYTKTNKINLSDKENTPNNSLPFKNWEIGERNYNS